MPSILSISRNARLLAARDDTLALAGYTVASPRKPNETLLLLTQRSFDAVIVGDSVEQEIRKILIPAIRKLRPQTPIVFVYRGTDTVAEPLADLSVDVTKDPGSLVTALDQRLRRGRSV